MYYKTRDRETGNVTETILY